MEKTIKAILLTNNQVLVSQIDEVAASVPGEPDCKLTNPFLLVEGGMLESWMMDATREDVFMISSDKIITIVDPTPTLIEKYEDLNK
jgi:hypothetical protein